MNIRTWIAAVALAFGASAANAADWQAVQFGAHESVYVDTDSIHADGALRKAWVLHNYSQTTTLGDSAFPHKSKLILYALRCEAGEAGYSQWSFHAGQLGSGHTVWADSAPSPSMQSAAFDPALEGILEKVCRS